MDNYIGRLLDNRYEILEAIGTGGMAVVYKARCHRLNRLVAIKVLKDELSQDAEFRRRFHAESQAVAMLSHHNIVNVYDVSHSENVDYIVMELIDGITLKQYMQQKGVLNWREALHFGTQIAKALEHAHSRDIIHRDIKPHNILILKDGTVKVADFGIARVSSAQSTLTREALGSVHYISPEQAKGSKIDYRSDIYSLGVVMYEMLTGQPPYDGETPVSVAIKHINANAPMPRSINAQIPVGLEQITMHAMAADPDDRYDTATDMLCDLDEFRRNPNVNFQSANASSASTVSEHPIIRTVQERSARRSSDVTVKTMPKRKNANSIALVAGIICIALALIFIGYFLYTFFFADILSTSDDIEVPELVGKYAEEIDQTLYPNFRIQIEEWQPNDTIPMGQVIRQEPGGGRMAKSGSAISLYVSSGPSTDTMRDLVNYTEQNARTILDNLGLGLQVKSVPESSDVIVSGAVIRTEPSHGESLVAGQQVTLIVSSGPEVILVRVPELVGKLLEDATRELDLLKLKYGISYVDSEAPEGTVTFQSVEQMKEVKEGTTINLQVSNGPKKEGSTESEGDSFFKDPTVIRIPMPSGKQTVTVQLRLDGEIVDEFPVELITISQDGLPIAPPGEGIQVIEVYIDGKLWHRMTYNFDTGEQID